MGLKSRRNQSRNFRVPTCTAFCPHSQSFSFGDQALPFYFIFFLRSLPSIHPWGGGVEFNTQCGRKYASSKKARKNTSWQGSIENRQTGRLEFTKSVGNWKKGLYGLEWGLGLDSLLSIWWIWTLRCNSSNPTIISELRLGYYSAWIWWNSSQRGKNISTGTYLYLCT